MFSHSLRDNSESYKPIIQEHNTSENEGANDESN